MTLKQLNGIRVNPFHAEYALVEKECGRGLKATATLLMPMNSGLDHCSDWPFKMSLRVAGNKKCEGTYSSADGM